MFGLALSIYLIFISLIWLGLMLINIPTHKKQGIQKPNIEGFNPKVLVMLPCKGRDLTLSDNILSLKNQDYKNFMLVGIVDTKEDEAVKELEQNMVDYIISKNVCSECSGKVKAIATAYEEFKGYDIYVIVDSDVEARKDWLSKLIAPLADESIGISTTFPIFAPKSGFWSKVKMVWGFVGDGMMESDLTRFGWGGSLAFRADLLEGKDYERFRESVSDDLAITKSAKERKLGIAYVKERIAKVNSNDSFKTFKEWANRQTALSIMGSKKVFYYGVIIYSLSILLLISAILLSVYVSYLFVILFAPFAIGIIKTYKRASGHISADLWIIYLLIDFIYLANLIHSKQMKSIQWRGNKYTLKD